MKKKIILISLGIVILAIAGACLYVSVIDWNEHKERIASQISSAIGEKVELSGDLKVSLFPHPKMSAKSVNIINPQNNEKLATIRQLDTAITLSSLIHGAPDIQSLSLGGVEIWIKFKKNGQTNWHKDSSSDTLGADSDLRLQGFNIQNSTIHLENKKYGIDFELDNFNAEIHADSFYGPYRLDGNFTKNDDRYGVAFSVDSLSQTEDINTAFAVVHPGSDSYLRYDGAYNFSSDTFKGMFSGSSQHTADFVNAIMNQKLLEDNFNTPLIFSVEATGATQKIDLNHFAVTYDTFFEGSGDISLPRSAEDSVEQPADIKYQLVNLDIRPLLNIIETRLQRYREGQNYEPDFPYHFSYDVSAVRMTVNDRTDGVVENVSSKGTYADGVFNLDDFYAGCAGNTVLTMSGNVSTQNGVPYAVANIVTESSDFKNFAASMGIELSAPTQGAYKNAKISASISATPTEIKIDELRAAMDKSEVTASGQFAPLTQEYQISFKADTVNLDNYIFPLKADESSDIISILKHDLAQIAELGERKLNLTAEIKAATFRGMSLKNLQFDAEYHNGNLTVSRAQIEDFLETEVRNITLSARQINTDTPIIAPFSYDIKSQNFAVLAQKLQLPLPQWEIFKQKNLVTSGTLDGDFSKVTLNSETALDGDTFNYDGTLEKKEDLWQFDGTMSLKSSRLENLLDKIGFAASDNKFYRGVFNGNVHIIGNNDELMVENIDCALGTTQYSGSLSFLKSKNIYTAKGTIKANDFNIAQFFKMQNPAKSLTSLSSDNTFLARPKISKAAIDFSWYRNLNLDVRLEADKAFYRDYKMNDFRTNVLNAQNILEFQNIAFNSEGTDVSGNIKIEYIQAPKMSGAMKFSNLKVNNLGGSVYAISGDNIFIDSEFETSASSFEDMLNLLSGSVSLSVNNLKIKGINLAAIGEDLQRRDQSKGLFQVVQDNLKSGATEFDPTEAIIKLKNGVAELSDMALNNSQVLAITHGDINLKDWKINVKTDVKYADLPDIEEYSFTFTGALNKPMVDVSIEKIVSKYDAYWQKVAQDEQQQKDDEMKALNDGMSAAQKKVTALADKVAEVAEQLEEYIAKDVMAENSEQYAAQKQHIGEIIVEIQAMQSKANQMGYTSDDIRDIESRVPELENTIKEIESNIRQDFSADLNRKMLEIKNNVDKQYSQAQNLHKEYRQMIEDDTKQLEKINSAAYITENANIKNWQSAMDNFSATTDDMYRNFNTEYESVQKLPDSDDKIAKINKLSAAEEQFETIYTQMQKTRSETAESLLQIVGARQEEYEREVAEAEKKRLAEEKENEGNLLIEKEETQLPSEVEIKLPSAEKPIETAPVVVPEQKIEPDPKSPESEEQKAEPREVTAEPEETVKEIIHIDLPDEIEDPASVPEAIEIPLDKISGGTILRTYEEPETEILEQPVKKLLQPTNGAIQKPSGTIFVQ